MRIYAHLTPKLGFSQCAEDVSEKRHIQPDRMSTTLELEMELGELLQEFNEVAEELSAPSFSSSRAYEHLLSQTKRSSEAVNDSGIEDTDEGSEPSRGNSLTASMEELSTAGTTTAMKAKLGDTTDLQSFIENLDKELAEM